MTNTLFLPELREMLAENNEAELREFCTALHPARTAEFMEGLDLDEIWAVLQYADQSQRAEIFRYFDLDNQAAMIESMDRGEVSQLIALLPHDERVDILRHVDDAIVDDILLRLPTEERRDILRLGAYPEGTAGAVMTTDFARLSEDLTVNEALDEVRRQVEHLETIYYLYVVDATDHLRGLVSLRQLVLAKADTKVVDIMQREMVVVFVSDDQEDVARKLAHFDLLAIPVVGRDNRMLGIITHDDVIDVVREEATEDAHRMSAVEPFSESYSQTSIPSMTRKRGVWLLGLFFIALLTVITLGHYEEQFARIKWLVLFIPLIISSGGNTGSQSATLVITAMVNGDVTFQDWFRIARRELAMGLLLGSALGSAGFVVAMMLSPGIVEASVVGLTLLLVVLCGALIGAMLPLALRKIGLDPALMSNPAVACIIDILGIIIYMSVAVTLMGSPAP